MTADPLADLRELRQDQRRSHANGRPPAPEPPKRATGPVLDEAALYGLPGRLVQTIAPTTEAHPAAILINALVFAGNVAGRVPHARGGGVRHGTNLYAVVVGKSRGGRKGTAAAVARAPFARAFPQWFEERVVRGLSSGEGLIAQVRDRLTKSGKDGLEIVLDEGVTDKRLCIQEPEFGVVLRVMMREGNTLSAHLRAAWDGDNLAALTKNPLRASAPHISILGQITPFELEQLLSGVDVSNGFANRFLWIHAHRAQSIPRARPPALTALNDVVAELHEAITFARSQGDPVDFDGQAGALWDYLYDGLVGENAVGLAAEVTSRGEAQVLRLALIYALLDRSTAIRIPHLAAAFAVWQYAEQSAYAIFGDKTGDTVADRILEALRQFPSGLSRTGISALFNRNQSAERLTTALRLLEGSGRLRTRIEETEGAPRTIYELNEIDEGRESESGPNSSNSFISFPYMSKIRAWLAQNHCATCGTEIPAGLVNCASCVVASFEVRKGGAS
jgi:hypothetical protein